MTILRIARHAEGARSRWLGIMRAIFGGISALTAGAASAASSSWPDAVEHALELAGPNRAQLERVLHHYEDDPQKLQSAIFLITNMDGHGYIENAFHDERGVEIEFNALDHANYREAKAAMDALEAEHGPIHIAKKSFHADLLNVSGDLLIENIDAAFAAWRGHTWARDIAFDVFCEYILPYRCTNEPVESWRPAVIARLRKEYDTLEGTADATKAFQAMMQASSNWVRFDEQYYLHPTDQGYAEMCAARTGRCEDMTTMAGYAFKASAIVTASDYTPYWAHRDNNHAWTVHLDANGHGQHPDGALAAKIYRKTFARQPESLGALLAERESVPPYLDGVHFIDVTDQYKDTTDVTVSLAQVPPPNARFAYLCVFNGGEWRPIQWGWIRDGSVTFAKMGRGAAYLPAYFMNDEVVPAGPPLILETDGTVTTLGGGARALVTLSMCTSAAQATARQPMRTVDLDRYDLLYWENGWHQLASVELSDEAPVTSVELNPNQLYWLTRKSAREQDRIFTVGESTTHSW